MAFEKSNLLHVAGADSVLNHTFEYYSTDTITGAGYFPKDGDIKAGDKVVKVVITKSSGLVTGRIETPYFVKADADGVLTAVSMEES